MKWLFLQTWVLLLVSFLIGALVTWLVTRPRKKAGATPADAAASTPHQPATPSAEAAQSTDEPAEPAAEPVAEHKETVVERPAEPVVEHEPAPVVEPAAEPARAKAVSIGSGVTAGAATGSSRERDDWPTDDPADRNNGAPATGVPALAPPAGRMLVDDLDDGPDLDTPAMGFPLPTATAARSAAARPAAPRTAAPRTAARPGAVASMNSTPRLPERGPATTTSSSRTPAAGPDSAAADGFAGSADDTIVIDADVAAGRSAGPTATASAEVATAASAGSAAVAPAAVVESPYQGGVLPLDGGAAPSPEFVIKGNVDSMLYHDPASPSYQQTMAEVWFRDSDDAEDAGFRPWNWRARTTGGLPKLGADGMPVAGSTIDPADAAALAKAAGRSSTGVTPTTSQNPTPTATASTAPATPNDEPNDTTSAAAATTADAEVSASDDVTGTADVAAAATAEPVAAGVDVDGSGGDPATNGVPAGAGRPGALGMVAGVDTDENYTPVADTRATDAADPAADASDSTVGDSGEIATTATDAVPDKASTPTSASASTNGSGPVPTELAADRAGADAEPVSAPHSAMQGLAAPAITELPDTPPPVTAQSPNGSHQTGAGASTSTETGADSIPAPAHGASADLDVDSAPGRSTDLDAAAANADSASGRNTDLAATASADGSPDASTTEVVEAPYGPGSARPRADGSAPSEEFRIKGNGDSMLYHTADSPYFGRTRPEAWFRTEEDAQRAGFSAWNRRARQSARALAKPAFEEGRYPGSAKPGKGGTAPTAEFTVKANEDSMLYHTADSPFFGVTLAEVWFRSEADAQRAGFTAWHAAAPTS